MTASKPRNGRWNQSTPTITVGLPNSLGGGNIANDDQWDGYRPARDRPFALPREQGIDNARPQRRPERAALAAAAQLASTWAVLDGANRLSRG